MFRIIHEKKIKLIYTELNYIMLISIGYSVYLLSIDHYLDLTIVYYTQK